MAVGIVYQLEVIQVQHRYRNFIPLIGIIVPPEGMTVSNSGKRIDISHIIQVFDIELQLRGELLEGCRKNADFILPVIFQLGIIVAFADFLRSFGQLLKGLCNPP